MIMQTEIGGLLERSSKISETEIFVKVFDRQDVKVYAIRLNLDQLEFNFINSEGVRLSDIGGDYSPVTLELSAIKGRPKQSASSINLKDSGLFYESFRVSKVDGSGFTIDADPNRGDNNLFEDWGEDIVGLTEASIEKLLEKIIPIFQEYTLKYLLGESIQ